MFSELLHFCQVHWLLSGAFLGSLVLFFWYERRYQYQRQQTNLSPTQLVQRMNRDEVVIIDIRSKTDFDQGHILGALHIPAASLETKPDQLKKYLAKKTVVLICQRGVTTTRVHQALVKAGFSSSLQCLEGGMTAWKEADLPVKTS